MARIGGQRTLAGSGAGAGSDEGAGSHERGGTLEGDVMTDLDHADPLDELYSAQAVVTGSGAGPHKAAQTQQKAQQGKSYNLSDTHYNSS